MKPLSLILTICIGVLIVPTSCTKDKCKTTTCANGGNCSDGMCTCAAGYEGANCETASCAKFLGNWEQVSSGEQFPVNVAAANGITNVSIFNFNNSFSKQPVSAYVSHRDSLIIPLQGIQGKSVVGYCHYVSQNNIAVHYELTDSATGDYG